MRVGMIRRRVFRSMRARSGIGRAIPMLIAAAAVTFFVFTAAENLRYAAVESALGLATDEITVTVNDVINEKLRTGSLEYKKIVELEKDTEGNITALITDIAGINTLQAEISGAIVDRFANTDITEVSIPLGNLVGGTIFSGRGPRISVKMLSVTNVTTEFRNEFTAAGINQTRHQILMDVTVDLFLLSGDKKYTDAVKTSVPIAETVIVGRVPDTYAKVG